MFSMLNIMTMIVRQVVREDEAESLEEHAGTSKINYQSR